MAIREPVSSPITDEEYLLISELKAKMNTCVLKALRDKLSALGYPVQGFSDNVIDSLDDYFVTAFIEQFERNIRVLSAGRR